jgi:hypothetical protein
VVFKQIRKVMSPEQLFCSPRLLTTLGNLTRWQKEKEAKATAEAAVREEAKEAYEQEKDGLGDFGDEELESWPATTAS